MAKDQYVAVIGSEEEFGEFEIDRRSDHEFEKKQLCSNLVRRLGLSTPRKEPKKIKVSVFSLAIVKGKLERRNAGSYEIDLPLHRMTADEYNAELKETLEEIPEEFRPYVSQEAYERGHSAGYEEVLGIAQEMIHNLKPCIVAFEKRVGKK